MPGWYTHMDAARKALADLETNAGAASIFASDGLTAGEISDIAKSNPAYVALGAIGPDIFFLFPDFKPPLGPRLWGAARTVTDLYTWWDENFLGPYENQIGPIAMNLADEVDAVTGGLASQLSSISARAFSFLMDAAVVLLARSYDIFGFLGSGVQAAFDEQTFFWSDMLHYRKTYEFAAHLWKEATNLGDPTLQAFALGWMTHLATDVAGHCFVNEKAGGPYRLHWQRHHLVENHIDAHTYNDEHASASLYAQISTSALHLWIAFNPDGSSRVNFFDPQPDPDYETGDDTPAILDRKSKWDFDSELPDEIGDFLAQALRDVYNDDVTINASRTNTGQLASHPTIIKDMSPGSDGYPNATDIAYTYGWLYDYLKFTTTDYYKTRRPEAPAVFNLPPFPSPPGTGEADPGPGATDPGGWPDFFEALLSLFAWLAYLAEVAAWPVTALISLIVSAGTYPIRQLLYENVELPLYNAWLSVHWYLAMTGFVLPMEDEINPGLTTLGTGVDFWPSLVNALNTPAGGLAAAPAGTEPSGRDRDPAYPHEAVTDPRTWLEDLIHMTASGTCGAGEVPSEFLRPWAWPDKDNEGDTVPSEPPLAPGGPYVAGDDGTALVGNMPGSSAARADFESSPNEQTTIAHALAHLPLGETLGGPIDYSGYVVARLTRNDPGDIANFNLDSDRGYGYLCWDWLRLKEITAGPAAYRSEADGHVYFAPWRPGYGWCQDDLANGHSTAGPGLAAAPHDPVKPQPVHIRYIDKEAKFK